MSKMKAFLFFAFLAVIGLTSAAYVEETISVREFKALQDSHAKVLARLEELETRLGQDDCPCDLSQISKYLLNALCLTSRLIFSICSETDIKTNAEDITRNTVEIQSVRSDVDEAVEIATGVSASLDGLTTKLDEVAGSVTSSKTLLS